MTDAERTAQLETYKAYLTDLGNIGARHTEENKFYVSLLSVLLVVLGLTGGKDAMFPNLKALQEGVAVLAISVSILWFFSITTFASLYRAKFRVLHELEAALGLPVSPFAAETQALGRYAHLTWIQRFAAIIMTVPFFILLAYLGAGWLWALLAADGALLTLLIITAFPSRTSRRAA